MSRPNYVVDKKKPLPMFQNTLKRCDKVDKSRLGKLIFIKFKMTWTRRNTHDSKTCNWYDNYRKAPCNSMMFIGVLLSTHLLFKDSQQKKRLITCFDFQLPTVVETKLSELCSCLLIYFQDLICVTETISQCSGNFPFQNQKVWMIDCGQGL